MSRQINECNWKIGGAAGFGIMASGAIFAKTCMRAGLHVFDYSEYPSLIHGGHNSYQVYAAPRQIWAHRTAVNILVALDRTTVDQHLDELTPGGIIVYDRSDPSFDGWHPDGKRSDVTFYGLPLAPLAVRAGGQKLMRNTVAIGATFALLSLDFDFPAAVVRDMFNAKGEQVAVANVAVMRAGYQAISPDQAAACPWDLNPRPNPPAQMLVAGNEAIGLGAIQAGCKFYAGYPMTPSTTLLHFMAEHGPAYNIVVRQAEDEIGVINETIGAAYTGVRAMCATAGGGFSLMTEAVGLAGMTEVGLVIVEAQRGGPSTGLPTWTGQDDLRQVLHASQGDFLKIVLAPADVEDCFAFGQEAFNLAERYQTPVIIMTDKYLAESHASVPPFHHRAGLDRGRVLRPEDVANTEFRRYRTDVDDGISPRTLPGTPNGLFLANSDEHDPYGYSNEEASMRLAQIDKRARKTAAAAASLPSPRLIGPAKADVTLVSWGSSLGPVKEAARFLHADHHLTANIIPLTVINPFPAAVVSELIRSARTTIMVEANQTGQMAGWIRQHTGLTLDHQLLRYDGRPFDPVGLTKDILHLVS